MQYNGKFINPYEVLGLPWESDFKLVKATYRSLVKIYHPDVFKGDKDFAKERLSQLNAAYEFLSDPEQKREFDKKDHSENQDEAQQDFDPDKNSNEFDEGINILKETWNFACDYYPELEKMYSDLKILSKESAFAFMAFVVETKEYAQAKSIAENLEDRFLTSKFSDDNQIKQIAKRALLEREIKFALELNKALKILGPNAKDKILLKLSEDFPDFTLMAYRESNCYNLISNNHPQKVKERSERHKEKVRSATEEIKAKVSERQLKTEKKFSGKSNKKSNIDEDNLWRKIEYSFYVFFILSPVLIGIIISLIV